MKKSVEILGLPIISITEGRELGVSKTLLIDAKNGAVAAITIEDEDWYRGVKLIPYEAIIAIGEDAVTITNSENILNLDEAGDYERLLVENIRVIGTKAITKSGYIQGKVTEVFIGEEGRIEKCEVTTPSGSIEEVTADKISIFGKQVTVIDVDREKKNNLNEQPAFEPVFEAFSDESASQTWTQQFEDTHESSEANTFSATEESSSIPELILPPKEEPETTAETQAELEKIMTPDPVVEEKSDEQPSEEKSDEQPSEEKSDEQPSEEKSDEQPSEEKSDEQPSEEKSDEQPSEEKSDEQPSEEKFDEQPSEEKFDEQPSEEKSDEQPLEEKSDEQPSEEKSDEQPVEEKVSEEDKKIAAMTQQAEDLKAALQKAREIHSTPTPQPKPMLSQKKQVEKAVDERRRRVLLGKHATKTITAESGTVVVEAGAEVTEEVLQRARLSNKFIELSMNVQ